MQASVAPKAAAKLCLSLQDGLDENQTNRMKASAAHPVPAAIAIQNGCTGFGMNCCPMRLNQTEPITKLITPASHAGTALH
jgi:hypothetical protein